MSATSDLLRLLRLDVDVYHNAKVCGNWHINEHSPGQSCFHVVTLGSCFLDIPEHFSTVLNTGDLLLFPRELPHSMTPRTNTRGQQRHLSYDEAHAMDGTGLLCAEIRFRHKASDFLLQALPPVMLIRNDSNSPWLQPLVALIVNESHGNQPVYDVIVNRICELLFSYALTHYLAHMPESPSLLALHANSRIAGSLAAVHANPDHAWTLEEMARYAAQSRSLFCRTFKNLSGWTPMQYITWWRMQLSWDYLERGEKVASVAEKVGYQSSAAFCRAFRKCFNVHAGEVRRRYKA